MKPTNPTKVVKIKPFAVGRLLDGHRQFMRNIQVPVKLSSGGIPELPTIVKLPDGTVAGRDSGEAVITYKWFGKPAPAKEYE